MKTYQFFIFFAGLIIISSVCAFLSIHQYPIIGLLGVIPTMIFGGLWWALCIKIFESKKQKQNI